MKIHNQVLNAIFSGGFNRRYWTDRGVGLSYRPVPQLVNQRKICKLRRQGVQV